MKENKYIIRKKSGGYIVNINYLFKNIPFLIHNSQLNIKFYNLSTVLMSV